VAYKKRVNSEKRNKFPTELIYDKVDIRGLFYLNFVYLLISF